MALGVRRAGEVVGRDRELGEADAWLERLQGGPAGLVFEGEAGIGKTTVWQDAARRAEAAGCLVLFSRPAATEAKLGFSSLADLLGPVDDARLEQLPGPQREALEVALLRAPAAGAGPERRAVATAMLSLVRVLAEDGPLVLAVDDLQWLDAPSVRVIEFALRRVDSERVGLLGSRRLGSAEIAHERIERVRLGPLSLAALHRVIVAELGRSLPRPALVRVGRAVLGNPFYAVEVARTLLEGGGTALGEPLPVPDDLRALTVRRIRALPGPTRDALLSAAALSRPDARGVDLAALAPAEDAGLVRVERGLVEFAHPLIASAVYDAAPAARRRDLHRRLAEVASDPEEQARHLALGTDRPDERVAASLDEAAALAAARGAPAAAAELLELALRLTPDGGPEEPRRRLALGVHLFEIGTTRGAIEAFRAAAGHAPPGLVRSEALFRLGWLLLLEGDRELGARTVESALEWASEPRLAGRIHVLLADARRTGLARAMEHGRQALELLDPDRDPDAYASALELLAEAKVLAGLGADTDLIERSRRLPRHPNPWDANHVGGSWAAGMDDFGTARRRYEELFEAYDEWGGPDGFLPSALARLAMVELWTGNWARAEEQARRALELSEQTEQPVSSCLARYPLGFVLAHQGRVDEARALVADSLAFLGDRPEPILRVQACSVLGFLELSLGDPAAAAAQLDEADRHLESIGWKEPFAFRFYGDQAEAAIELGELERAEGLVQRLEASARRIPRPWIAGVAARGRGLLCAAGGDLDAALVALERAASEHARLDIPFERARTLVALGRLRRRHKQKRAAREALTDAQALFVSLGAPLWTERAAAELGRVGLRTSSRTELSETERRVAELAAEGLSNREVAERAFVSPRTVEGVLTRVYRKLGVRSRSSLARALDAGK
jgi:DNA-binding CsgD family transcriptional regulator